MRQNVKDILQAIAFVHFHFISTSNTIISEDQLRHNKKAAYDYIVFFQIFGPVDYVTFIV